MSYYVQKETTETMAAVRHLSGLDHQTKTQRAQLILLKSPNGLEAQPLYKIKKGVILGRKDSADIALNDPKLSRHHAQIYTDGKHYYIKDLNSTNGTKVNGQIVKEQRIRPKDIIEIGDLSFEFNFPTIVPSKSKDLSSKKSSWFSAIKLLKTIGLVASIIFCLWLVYFSATKPFKIEARKPQSISQNETSLGTSSQADLFYQMANQAYAEGDYEKAQRFAIDALNRNPKSLKFQSMARAIEEVLILKTTYMDKIKTREEQEKIQEQLQFYFMAAQHLIKDKEWDRAIIAYKDALLIDEINQEAKKGIFNVERLRHQKEPAQAKSNSTLDSYQVINKLLASAHDLEKEERYAQAIQEYKKALELSKKYEFNTNEITIPLMSTVEDLKTKIRDIWTEADTLFQAQKYSEAKEKINKILWMHPQYQPALEKQKELDAILDRQAKGLYAKAVISEALPDIDGAKQQWNQIITLLSPNHPYYKKAQRKLAQYPSF